MHQPLRLMRSLTRRLTQLPCPKKRVRSQFILLLAVVALTGALGQRFYNAPKLDVGKSAPQTIYAPISLTVEDSRATEEKRRAARSGVISVLTPDTSVRDRVLEEIEQQFRVGNDLREIAGTFPFESTSGLSTQTQTYLRKADDADWQKILSAAGLPQNSGITRQRRTPSAEFVMNASQRQAIAELRNYRQSQTPQNYFLLVDKIHKVRQNYTVALAAIPTPSANSPTIYDPTLLDLSDAEWQQTQAKVRQVAERMLAQGIPDGLPKPALERAVQLQVKDTVPPVMEPFATRLLMATLKPNLVKDENQSRQLAEEAAQAIEPEMVSIRQGEAIVRAGEVITTADFALLDYFQLSRRGIDWLGLLGYAGLVSAAVIGYWLIERRFHPKIRQRDRLLIVLLALSTSALLALRVPSTNLPAVGLLVSTFYSSPLGVTVTGLLALLLPIGQEMKLAPFLSSAVAGLICAALAGRLRSREELALLGAGIGVVQGVLYLVLSLPSNILWYNLLGGTAIHALLGLAWSVVAIGVSPYLEQVFDLVTTLRLVELANPNRPLLKRLAAEAPGTFQHTLFVATLAEAAARTLGCNVELVRTGTLYHDIGKMHDPQGFIENQRGAPNKHDQIDDPWVSADIIKKHVTEGLLMARKCRLPLAVQAFIPEHQGTMLIAYFYHQAQQRAQQQDVACPRVQESDFRYNGPIPQSRETGIVMLADSCEAALRSLKDATPQEALAMVNKILRARWQDNQLIQSGLSRDDLKKIADVFVEVWLQFNHQRIPYPKLGSSAQPSTVKG